MASAPRDVEFKSGGLTCRAWLFEPDTTTGKPAPCIAMAHGLGGTRHDGLAPYAERFCSNGFYVLVFDYCYQGDSDGEPRQIVSVSKQLEDWTAAIAFARSCDGIDPKRIGLWGTSFSGGHVVSIAAKDPQIAAISAQCPMMDGAASARMAFKATHLKSFLRIVAAGISDAARSLVGAKPTYIPLVAPLGGAAAMATHDAHTGYTALAHDKWRNEVAARFVLTMPMYRPISHARAVSCPALIIVCLKDTVVSNQASQTAADRIGPNARLVKLPIGHFEIYKGEWLECSSDEQAQFFKDTLNP